MNPAPWERSLVAYEHQKRAEAHRVNQERLHKKAVARRKKAKRGGKR